MSFICITVSDSDETCKSALKTAVTFAAAASPFGIIIIYCAAECGLFTISKLFIISHICYYFLINTQSNVQNELLHTGVS